jgi:PHD/YefM family antitoxin component YafN of YafNO toxin-antitoxin module
MSNTSQSTSEGAPRPAIELYQNVARKHQRIEVLSPDGPCVIISKAELEGLEKALRILSETDNVKMVSQSLAQVAAACNAASMASA